MKDFRKKREIYLEFYQKTQKVKRFRRLIIQKANKKSNDYFRIKCPEMP